MTINDYTSELVSYEVDHNFLNKIEKIIISNILVNSIREVMIDQALANSYIGNFYGLLHNHFKINIELWYLLLRLNGYNNSLDYNGETIIKIPDPEKIETIMELIKTENDL